jgi:hypothetical protein
MSGVAGTAQEKSSNCNNAPELQGPEIIETNKFRQFTKNFGRLFYQGVDRNSVSMLCSNIFELETRIVLQS